MAENFESVESIELFYAQKAATTPEEQRLALEVEKSREIAGYYQRRDQARERSIWEQEALREFPHATKDDLRGNSIEEIKAAAKARHEAVQAKIDEAIAAKQAEIEERLGRAAYAGGVGGGGTPIPDTATPEAIREKGLNGYANRPTGLAARRFGSGGELTPVEIQRRQIDHLQRIVNRKAEG